jgi:hypothetical protein
MCSEALLTIYEMFSQSSGQRIASIEGHLGPHSERPFSAEDLERNQAAIYAALFSPACRVLVEGLYQDSLRRMNGLPFDGSQDLLSGLAFLQDVIAKALWKYECDVGGTLEAFARGFDRLDVPSERRRLHELAQQR